MPARTPCGEMGWWAWPERRGIGVAKKRAVAREYIGKRGEAIATAALLDFCGNQEPYFDPHFLGEKCPTYDFLVELLGAGASPPYFLAQLD